MSKLGKKDGANAIFLAATPSSVDEVLVHTQVAIEQHQQSPSSLYFSKRVAGKNPLKKVTRNIHFSHSPIQSSFKVNPKSWELASTLLSKQGLEELACCGSVKEFLPSKPFLENASQDAIVQTSFLKSLPWSVTGKELAYSARLLLLKNKHKP